MLILNYCKQKYGNHVEELYEGNSYNTKMNKCQICGNPARYKWCSRKCSGILLGNIKKVPHTGVEPVQAQMCLKDENLAS